MSLTHNQVVKLLAYLAAYDQRTVGEEDVLAWTDAADFGRWTPDQARTAVRQLANTSRTHRVQPADVTELIKAWRQEDAMRHTTAERAAARRAVEGSVARAIERGTVTGDPAHVGEHHVDAIYDQHGWSPTARAAARHKCPGCREEPGHPCSRPTAREAGGRITLRDPHPSRVALIVACPTSGCGSGEGETCGDEHPHHAREMLAIGDAGLRRRKARTTELRALSADPDWTREIIHFTMPSPDDDEPPADWLDALPVPRETTDEPTVLEP